MSDDPKKEVPFSGNVAQDIVSLSEGRFIIQWPLPLSIESVEEIKEFLKIFERKIGRFVPPE